LDEEDEEFESMSQELFGGKKILKVANQREILKMVQKGKKVQKVKVY
jgi:hypothetical protein